MRRSTETVKASMLVLILIAYLSLSCSLSSEATEPKGFEPVFQKGMSYRHYPFPYDSSFSDESLERVAETGIEYVAITVWWLQENISATEIYRKANWTATDTALSVAVARAHELGLKVMLKPMVDPEDVWAHWRGEILGSPEWFKSYETFVSFYAEFAEQNNVDLFCVGCEFKATEQDETSWGRVVDEVRKRYSSPLAYAALFDSFQGITWWDRLDYVGIDAYFPLTTRKDPSLDELEQAWIRMANAIERWASTITRPIIFTEIGYRSGDGSNLEPANWIATLNSDLQEQFDCYSAAFQVLWNKPWFYGFYWWIWETDPNAGGINDSDYTPQNKPTESLVRSWYSLERHVEQTSDFQSLILYSGISAAVIAGVSLVLTRRFRQKEKQA